MVLWTAGRWFFGLPKKNFMLLAVLLLYLWVLFYDARVLKLFGSGALRRWKRRIETDLIQSARRNGTDTASLPYVAPEQVLIGIAFAD